MQSKIVIPARLASTRLPEKLLRVVSGKSILQRTYESASRCRHASSLVAAVDDSRLLAEVQRFGGEAVMTSVDCESGTDRVAEAALADLDSEIFVNVQGDEPEIDPDSIDQVIELLSDHPQAAAATLATPIRDVSQFKDPNCVKVALESGGYALYFSRSPIPLPRDDDFETLVNCDPPLCWQHIGLYAYRRSTLEWFTAQRPSPLELAERLEQLRLLEAGRRIIVGRTDKPAIGIDTEKDLAAFERKLHEP